jgi:hypothetical protein
MRIVFAVLASLLLLGATSSRAAVIWNESGGDLSGNRLAPSAFVLATGGNNLIGSVVGGDLDYVTLTVPASMQLTGITLVSYASADARAFIGVQQGPTFTESPAAPNVANILGYTHFGPGGAPAGTNILDDMATGAGAQGFVPPLPAGQYTFWIQQLGALTSYNFDFVVVPEPSTWLLAGLGAMGALIFLRSPQHPAPRRRAKRSR